MAIQAEDEIDITIVNDGYTVVLSNENHTFVGNQNGVDGTQIATCKIQVLLDGEEVPCTIGNIDCPNGLTVSNDDASPSPTLTFSANEKLTSGGSVALLITVDEETSFEKIFTWSISFKGERGEQGIQGEQGKTGDNGKDAILISESEPSSPKIGQLWQTASGEPIKRWDGSNWVIHYISVDNLKVDNLSAISSDLGNVTAGSIDINGLFTVNQEGFLTAVSGTIGGLTINKNNIVSKSVDGAETKSYTLNNNGEIALTYTGGGRDFNTWINPDSIFMSSETTNGHNIPQESFYGNLYIQYKDYSMSGNAYIGMYLDNDDSVFDEGALLLKGENNAGVLLEGDHIGIRSSTSKSKLVFSSSSMSCMTKDGTVNYGKIAFRSDTADSTLNQIHIYATARLYLAAQLYLKNEKAIYAAMSDGTWASLIYMGAGNYTMVGYTSYRNSIENTGTRIYGNEVQLMTRTTITGNKAYTNSSDRRLKKDIEDIPNEFVNLWLELKPKRFKYKNSEDDLWHIGFVAQDVIELFEKYNLNYEEYGFITTFTVEEDETVYFALTYEYFDVLTLLVSQKQQNTIKILSTRLDRLEKLIGGEYNE